MIGNQDHLSDWSSLGVGRDTSARPLGVHNRHTGPAAGSRRAGNRAEDRPGFRPVDAGVTRVPVVHTSLEVPMPPS